MRNDLRRCGGICTKSGSEPEKKRHYMELHVVNSPQKRAHAAYIRYTHGTNSFTALISTAIMQINIINMRVLWL